MSIVSDARVEIFELRRKNLHPDSQSALRMKLTKLSCGADPS